MNPDFKEGQIILIDKPYKWTSFDVVGKIRSLLKYKLKLGNVKTGHAGTLDPLATGLLIICTGKFTKKIEKLQGDDKEYTGIITLGAITPSYDLETEPEQFKEVPALTENTILNTANSFIGRFMQTPPVYSARYVNGKRAYTFARAGVEIKMEPREVVINSFTATIISKNEIGFTVNCSKGTYIRTLANDFGEKLGCGAYLSSLRRTRSGKFFVEDAISPDEFEKQIVLNF